MGYRALADLTVLLHLGFILFVVFGVFLVARWPRLFPGHLACAGWGAYTEFTGTVCPLTPLENQFRHLAGEAGYESGFIAHYLWPLIYPAGLTPTIQVGLGVGVLVLNAAGYAFLWHRRRRARLESTAPSPGQPAP